MSEITSRIQQYRDGGSDWPTLRDWLVDRHYVDARRNADPQPGGPLDQRDWDSIYVDGSSSWDEVQKSRADPRLTDTQYREVSRGIDARLYRLGNRVAFLRSVTE
jgi:hypothetical protein